MQYDDAIETAAGLFDGPCDPEYRRGVVNLLAELYPIPFTFTGDRMDQIERDLSDAIERNAA